MQFRGHRAASETQVESQTSQIVFWTAIGWLNCTDQHRNVIATKITIERIALSMLHLSVLEIALK